MIKLQYRLVCQQNILLTQQILQKRLAGASLTPQDEDDLISAVHERGFAEKAGELALTYADEAEKALERFPESEAREALSRLLGSAITGA